MMRDPAECPVCGGFKWPGDRTCSDKCESRLVIDWEKGTYYVLEE